MAALAAAAITNISNDIVPNNQFTCNQETEYPIPNPLAERGQIMWGLSDTEIYIPTASSTTTAGSVLKFDGDSVEPFFTATDTDFIAAWAADSDNIWAIGDGVGTAGGAYRIDSDGVGTLYNLEQGVSSVYNHLYGTGNNQILAVGNSGEVRLFDGVSWSILSSGTTNNLEKVFALDSTHFYLSGASGTILFWDGATFTNLNFPDTTKRVSAIWGTSPTDIWFGTTPTPGAVWHYDGNTFTSVYSGVPGFFAMDGVNSESIWGGGNLVIHYYDGDAWGQIRDYTGYVYSGNVITGFSALFNPETQTVFVGLNPANPVPANGQVLIKLQCAASTALIAVDNLWSILPVALIGGVALSTWAVNKPKKGA